MVDEERLRAQRGISIVELLVALVVFLVVAMAMFGIIRGFARGAWFAATSASGSLTIETQLDAMRGEAATAFAVFVPDRDILAANNADGHELDFYSRTDDGRPVFWAYRFDPTAKTLARYDYDLAGHRGVADRLSGIVDTTAAYPLLTNIVSFTARKIFASQLADATHNVYGGALAPLFNTGTPKPLPVGFDDGGAQRTDLYGGNMTIEIALATARASRTIHLATGALPSGFTVHANPEFRVVIWRHDTTSKTFPFRSVSRVYINAQLLVSYNRFATAPIVWCDYNIYGAPEGLRRPYNGFDQYHPDWFVESTAGVLWNVTHGNTNGSTCPLAPPPPTGVPVARYSPPPQVTDTPNP